MKKIFCIVLGIAALMACTKETDFSSNNEDLVSISENGQKTYSVTAIFEEVTKAAINETNGKFSWSGDEQIAIWDSAHDEFVTFDIDTYSNEGEKRARFTTTTAKDGASFVGNVAYYPASIATKTGLTPSYNFPTSFSSKDAAAKGFPMQGTVTGNEIKFSHLGCLINITMNNVPSFTTKLILNDGTNNITVPVSPSAGVLNAVVPIPAGTYVLTAKLEDDNSNVFYTKARISTPYSASHYYKISAISLRSLIEFTNASDITSVGIQQKTFNAGTNDYTDYGEYKVSGKDYELFTRGTTKYFVLPEYSWTTDLSPIRIVAFSSTYPEGSDTKVVFARNITVDASESTMKMIYAIFPYNKNNSLSTPSCYVYLPAQFKLYMNYTTPTWGDLRIHCWDKSTYVWGGNMTPWDSDPTVSTTETIGGTTYRVHTFADDVDDKTFNIIFRAGSAQSEDLSISYEGYAIHLFGQVYGDSGKVYWVPDVSKTVYRTRLNGDWPGNAIVKLNDISTTSMIPIPNMYYGQTVNAKFSDNGSNVSSEWGITVNRDYTYGY